MSCYLTNFVDIFDIILLFIILLFTLINLLYYTLYSRWPLCFRVSSAVATADVSYWGSASWPLIRDFRPPHVWNVVITELRAALGRPPAVGKYILAVSLPRANCLSAGVDRASHDVLNAPPWGEKRFNMISLEFYYIGKNIESIEIFSRNAFA